MKKIILWALLSIFAIIPTMYTMAQDDDEETAPKPKKEKPEAKEITVTGTFECKYDDEGNLKNITFKVDEKTTYNVAKKGDGAKLAEANKGKTVKVTGMLRGKNLNVTKCESVEADNKTEPDTDEDPFGDDMGFGGDEEI